MSQPKALLLALCLTLISSCAYISGRSIEIARNENTAIIYTGHKDSYAALAQRYLSDARLSWVIQDFNNSYQYQAGNYIAIPLTQTPHFGFYDNFEQQTPILVYHNFGTKNTATTITPEKFEQQLTYLINNNFTIISLKHYFQHITAGKKIPQRAVIITIDDGYRATFSLAFPILMQLNVPATVFIYSDYISNGGLSRKQLNKMVQSKLIDIQPHSKTHRNFNRLQKNEDLISYQKNIHQEIALSAKRVEETLKTKLSPRFFAYPYGEVNPIVTKQLQQEQFDLAFTVVGQSNKNYSAPFLLKRYQIFGNHSFEIFKRIIESNKDFH